MSPLVTLPVPDFEADTDAYADDVDANFAAIVSVLNGGLDDSNCSDAMRLNGNKLSNESGKQVPEDRLGTNAVSNRVLASHATTDASRAVTTDHLRDLSVTVGKIALLSITNAQMAVGAALANLAAASIPSSKLKVTLATAAISVTGVARDAPQTALLTLSGTFAKATYDLYGAYIKNPGGVAYTTDNAVAQLYPDDAGTNWTLRVKVTSGNTGAGATFTGTAVVVFIAKT